MAEIYKYRKIIGQYTTFCLVEPDYNLLERDDPAMEGVRITELCTLDDWTYASVPDAIALPPQPEVIASTLAPVDLSEQPELKAAIIEASPNCRSIRGRVVDKIRERYSINDEFKMLRIGPSPETEAYNDYVEACRAWGRSEKEKLGL